jgi:hypothetical protein
MRFNFIITTGYLSLLGCLLVHITSCTFFVSNAKPALRNIYFYDPKKGDSCFFIKGLDLSNIAKYRIDSLRVEQKYLKGTLIDMLHPQSDEIRFSKKYFEGWRPVKSNENIYLVRASKQICSPFQLISKTDSLGKFKIKLSNKIKSGIIVFGDSRLNSMSYLVITFN